MGASEAAADAAAVTRRRLLFVLPELRGGGAPRVLLSLLGELDAARYEVSLLVLGGSGDELSPFIPASVRPLYPCWWMPRGLLGARLATLWYARDQDLLIAGVEMRATFCVHFAARLLRKPAIAWVHIAFEHWVRGFSQRHHRRSRRAYRDIAHVVFVSEGARASMQRWLGGSHPQWRVIPNLFSERAYERAPTARLSGAAQQLLVRMATRPTVLGIGRLEARKGFDVLLAAAARAIAAGADFDVVLLGEGPLRGKLGAQAQQAGIGSRVFMPGYVSNPLPWLRAATIFALSSRLEGLPTTIIEALAAGTPVVATNCPSGPAEILQDGRAGMLVAVDDAAALAEALRALLQSPALRGHYVTAGRLRLAAFDPAQVVGQWDALIAEVLADARAG